MARVPTDRFAEQLQETVRRVLGQRPGDLGTPFELGTLGQNSQFLRVTGSPTASGGIDYYPAKRRVKNSSTGAWTDAADGATLWLENIVGDELVTDGTAIYWAKQFRDQWDVSGTIRPLFVTVGTTECETAIDSFATMDETSSSSTTAALVTDPTLGTRRIQTKDWRKVMQKGEGVVTVTDPGTGTITFNLNAGVRQQTTMTGNRSLALSNEFSNALFTLRLAQDATGNRQPTWFSGIIPMYGVMPPVLPLANAVTEYGFERLGAGSYRLRGYNSWLS